MNRRRSLGYGYGYWIAWSSVLALALVTMGSAKGDRIRFLGSIFFAAGALLGLCFPFMRLAEKEGIRFSRWRAKNRELAGLLIRTSRSKNLVLSLGSLLAAAWMACVAPGEEGANAMKAWLGALVFAGIFIVFAVTTARNRPGILLTADAIVWSQPFESPVFVPWDAIAETRGFSRKSKTGAPWLFGLRLLDEHRAETTPGTLNTLRHNLKTDGFHLRYEAEDLLAALEDLQRIVTHYRENPADRHELDTGVALHRFGLDL